MNYLWQWAIDSLLVQVFLIPIKENLYGTGWHDSWNTQSRSKFLCKG